MGLLDRESDTIKDLCIIRKPIVWHRDKAPSALTDYSDESDHNLERSRRNDSDRTRAVSVMSMMRGLPTVPKARRIKAQKVARMYLTR